LRLSNTAITWFGVKSFDMPNEICSYPVWFLYALNGENCLPAFNSIDLFCENAVLTNNTNAKIKKEELSEKGWFVKILVDDNEITNTIINPYSSKEIKIRLYSTRNDPTYIDIILEIDGKDYVRTVTLSMNEYPILSSTVGITGKNVISITSEDNSSWVVIGAIMSVFLISFFVLYRRREQ